MTVQEWTVWKAYIDAESTEAEAKAQTLWDDEGPDAFTLDNCGTDSIEADDIGPAESEEAAL